MPLPERPILHYATPKSDYGLSFIKPMRWWRAAACGSLFVFTLALVVSVVYVAAIGFLGALVASVMTLIYMARAATNGFGAKYAAKHICLALGLLPLLFLGIVWIPLLVESDLRRWRTEVDPDDTI